MIKVALLFFLFTKNYLFATDLKLFNQSNAIIANQISRRVVLKHPFERFSPVNITQIPENENAKNKLPAIQSYDPNLGFYSKKEITIKGRFVFWGGLLFKKPRNSFLFGVNIITGRK